MSYTSQHYQHRSSFIHQRNTSSSSSSRHRTLPSLSSSVSSCSSANSIPSPSTKAHCPYYYYSSAQQRYPPPSPERNLAYSKSLRITTQRPTSQLPQRSASAGSLARQQQQPQRHSTSAYEIQSNADRQIDRRVSFNQRVTVIPTLAQPEEEEQTSVQQTQPKPMIWDDSLELELAEDDLIATSPKHHRSFKERFTAILHPRDLQTKVSSSSSNRFARSLKKLSGFLF